MPDNQTIETIKAVGAIITPIVLAYIAFKQVGLSKKQDAIRKDVDGKMTQLLEATGAKERAEGKAEGKSEQRAEGKEDNVTATSNVQDVKIVEQKNPVKVIVEKPK